MISVPIDRIVPLTDARDNFSRLVADVENITDGLYVLTKGGKPAIALINIKYLEEIMEGREKTTLEHSDRTSHQPDHKAHESMPRNPASVTAPVSIPKIVSPPSTPKSAVIPPLPPLPPHPKQSFEVPPITPAPIGNPLTPTPRLEGSNTPAINEIPKAPNSYDVKPVVNPSWTGETITQSTSTNTPITSPPKPAEAPISSKPDVGSKPPSITLPPPAKPAINPWPIIPPRPAQPIQKPYEPSSPVPPKPIDTTAVNTPQSSALYSKPEPAPQAPSAPPSTQDSSSDGTGVNSYPKMVAPPPPPPPSSLPRIPSSFQTVPVPVNGNKPMVSESSTPTVPLPPPPKVDSPAPFLSTSVTAPKTPSPIQFDQPPTTVPEPGEGLISSPPTASSNPGVSQPPSPAPPTPPPSVQDVEI